MTLLVACSADTTVTVTWPATHLCPHVPEIDHGSIEIAWTTVRSTLELHALKAWLDGFAGDRISHEDMTHDVHDHLSALPGITSVQVITRWITAGGEVTVRAVPGEPHLAQGS